MLSSELIFQGFAESGRFWLSAAVCIGAAWLIVLLMRYERQLVSRRIGITLLLLRLSVLLLLLATFLQPAMTRTIDRQKTSRVVVAVDISESMDTADEHATNAELLRVARAAGLIGNGSVNQRLDAWIAAWEAGEEPVWVDESEAASPAQRAELAALRRQNIDQVLETARSLPRREIARRILTESQTPLLSQLSEVADVDIQLFSTSSETATADGLSELLAERNPALNRTTTDLSLSLTAPASDTSSQLAGIVILSDGRHTAASDPIEPASRLGLLGVPAIPVAIGSRQQPKDISIQSVDHPQIVYLDDSLSIGVRTLASGYAGEELTLTLTHPDGTEESQPLLIPESGPAVVDTRFTFTADEAGRSDYQLKVASRPDETRDDNNTRTFSVNVVDDRSNVLLVDSEPRWDFRYLQTALERDERTSVTPVVFNQPYLGILPDTFFSRRLPFNALQFDAQHSPLADFDLIVVGDVSPGDFDSRTWSVVEHWVRDLGGTLVFSAGREAMPRAHRSPSLDRLLPVSQFRELSLPTISPTALPDEMGFHLSLTDDGADEDVLRLAVDPLENRRVWQSLPGHMWGLTGTARPTATVLLTATGLPANALGPQGSTLSPLQRERQTGILVQQYYGFGRVLWLGIDSTWRWRHRRGDELHHRFWGQIARWASRNKASAGNDIVRLSLSKTHIEPGETVTVQARWQKRFLDQYPNLKAAIEFIPADSSPQVIAEERKPSGPANPDSESPLRVDLTATARQPDLFEAVMTTLPPGAWTVRLVVEQADLGSPVEADLYVAQARTAETADLTANHDLLTRIAAASVNGRLLLPDQTDQIIPLLNIPEDATEVRQELTLWDHWLTMLAFFALLTTEWITRKLNGLP